MNRKEERNQIENPFSFFNEGNFDAVRARGSPNDDGENVKKGFTARLCVLGRVGLLGA